MALGSLIRIFVMTILFNLFLPTGDIYSDIGLMLETIQFRVSDSYEILGCRACHGKTEADIAELRINNCLCARGTGRTHLFCGEKVEFCGNFVSSFRKMIELDNLKHCENFASHF